MLTGAIIGAIAGLLVVVLNYFAKEQRFKKILKSIKEPGMEYAALYYYASSKRYRASLKFYDSYGLLYIVGQTVYYKTGITGTPLAFNLAQCTVQQEADWRRMKWFSIATPDGEKYYFNSNKTGAFVSNSDETLKGLSVIKAKIAFLH
jgi:hypothetical protein